MGFGAAEALEHVATGCLVAGQPGQVGVELEWLVHDVDDPRARVAPDRLAAALPAASELTGHLSTEPGGQLELSSRPGRNLAEVLAEVRADMAALRARLAGAQLRLAGAGADAYRSPRRVRHTARYAAMEEYFDRSGPDGRIMMCGTASVQINLDAGRPGDGPGSVPHRWAVAHAIGPVLVAAFANSPHHAGRATGWKSTRQAVWSRLDRSRCGPVGGTDPRASWARYALDAQVMCVRGDEPWQVPAGLTFRDWLAGAGTRPAAADDLDYHLSTLFPPVRPRRWLELRMVDAQPGEDGWVVPLAVAVGLIEDETAADRALDATRASGPEHPGPWLRAARDGLADPELRVAASACFGAALGGLGRLGAPPEVVAEVEQFAERYVARGRCPADDHLAPVACEPTVLEVLR